MKRGVLIAVALVALSPLTAADKPGPTAKEALQVFNDLIGSWKGTGQPQGTREERDKGFWQETIAWQWQFKDKDVWLRGDLDKGKHYTRFEIRYLPEKDAYELKAITPAKETHTFTGKFEEKRLTVDRADDKNKRTERLVFSLLHFNRHLYRFEVRPEGHTTFARVYQVGATKLGVAFASEDKGIECIVSGGKGTIPVSYKGKTYYVCCTGCRDAFNEEPEKYIKEYEEAKKKK
jgi:YHS domain-containing protein